MLSTVTSIRRQGRVPWLLLKRGNAEEVPSLGGKPAGAGAGEDSGAGFEDLCLVLLANRPLERTLQSFLVLKRL